MLYEHLLDHMSAIVTGQRSRLGHTVASVITKAALFEHMAMSESVLIIFLTRATSLKLMSGPFTLALPGLRGS
jgi:hypothetical protein